MKTLIAATLAIALTAGTPSLAPSVAQAAVFAASPMTSSFPGGQQQQAPYQPPAGTFYQHNGPTTYALTQLSHRYGSDRRNAAENCGGPRPLSICGAKNRCSTREY
jgi:hypothetical protein